ncbi:MAG: restriction endonuclease [Methanobacteriaceae archaeon]|nr:restriction endonuclease [Methanobacteriaceae archaeon]
MEKPQLINFIANILEESGFKVYKNFKTTQQIVDIYAVLPTSMGDFALVVGCKNYDKEWTVGIDVLKEMEMVGKNLKASKVCIITSSKFSEQAIVYAEERHIKLVDRKGLIKLAKKYNDKKKEEEKAKEEKEITNFYDYYPNGSTDSYNYDEDVYYNEGDDLDYETYDEYDDNRYRAEYLNSSSQVMLHRKPAQRVRLDRAGSNPNVNNSRINLGKVNNLGGRFSNLTNKTPKNSQTPKGSLSRQPTYYNNRHVQRKQVEYKPLSETLKPYLKNPVVDIFIVVVISYIIGVLLGYANIPTGYLGLIELIMALLLSYGIVFYSDREHPDPLIKGTVIFFISLVILMILIVLT